MVLGERIESQSRDWPVRLPGASQHELHGGRHDLPGRARFLGSRAGRSFVFEACESPKPR